MALPLNRFVRCFFYTPIGVENVRLNEVEITGDWKKQASEYYGEKGLPLAQRFANLPCEAESILKFIERWGPLFGNPFDRDRSFRFTIEGWIEWQDTFRRIWRANQVWQGLERSLPTGALALSVTTPEPIEVEVGPKAVALRMPNLFKFMCFELHCNIRALRVCKRPGCKKPYFLAQHGKERYCSTECANWAQSEWKKRWHKGQRQKRLKGKESNVTKKTR